jgi:hypothetical protein
MKTIHFVLMTALLLGVSAAFSRAEDAAPDKKEQDQFQMMKTDTLKDLDARIGTLQKVRECITAAADHAAIKKCHEMEQSEMKSFVEARKAERIKRIEQQQKELEQEKQRLLNEPKP